MITQSLSTPTPPILGDQDIEDMMPIDYAELVNDEGFINRENSSVPNLNPSRCYPRGLNLTRHSVAVFADINAVDSRMAAVNDAVASTVPQRLQRAVKRAQSSTGNRGDEVPS